MKNTPRFIFTLAIMLLLLIQVFSIAALIYLYVRNNERTHISSSKNTFLFDVSKWDDDCEEAYSKNSGHLFTSIENIISNKKIFGAALKTTLKDDEDKTQYKNPVELVEYIDKDYLEKVKILNKKYVQRKLKLNKKQTVIDCLENTVNFYYSTGAFEKDNSFLEDYVFAEDPTKKLYQNPIQDWSSFNNFTKSMQTQFQNNSVEMINNILSHMAMNEELFFNMFFVAFYYVETDGNDVDSNDFNTKFPYLQELRTYKTTICNQMYWSNVEMQIHMLFPIPYVKGFNNSKYALFECNKGLYDESYFINSCLFFHSFLRICVGDKNINSISKLIQHIKLCAQHFDIDRDVIRTQLYTNLKSVLGDLNKNEEYKPFIEDILNQINTDTN